MMDLEGILNHELNLNSKMILKLNSNLSIDLYLNLNLKLDELGRRYQKGQDSANERAAVKLLEERKRQLESDRDSRPLSSATNLLHFEPAPDSLL